MSLTLLDAVRKSLKDAGAYHSGDMDAPAAILWTDADSQWQTLVQSLRAQMPELLTLGTHNPEESTGPAIWLRCIVDRTLEPKLPAGAIPVIYMPGVSRQTLRAAEDCPDSLKPLIELQFRGAIWTQKNGKDWTVEAFLVSDDGGLGLDVARDQRTRNACLGAISQLATTPLATLRGHKLEAEDFDKLMIDDTTRDLLVWMNDPDAAHGGASAGPAPGMARVGTAAARAGWSTEKWKAFCSRCQDEYELDPVKDGQLAAGELLGKREGEWHSVWNRFTESPALYSGIPELLRRSKPASLIFDQEPWPDCNETQEAELRTALQKLAGQPAAAARKTVNQLEKEHGSRRAWVWARLGCAPLARALQYLNTLACETEHTLGGDTKDAMADLYAKSGFLADDAALRALASVKSSEDQAAVEAAVRALYLPWLEDAALHLQKLFVQNPPASASKTSASSEPGQCILFCDGLRFDLAQRLVALAEERHLRVTISKKWAALPTVTATAKPAVSPVSGQISGTTPGQDFRPDISSTAQPLTHERFQKLLEDAGYQCLSPKDRGNSVGDDALAWTEFGEFDKAGHSLQRKLVSQLDDGLAQLLERIIVLMESGWRQVKVVTDHGWLLMPGGLPVVSLPKYLTESRWSRCASIKTGSKVDVPLAQWHWNPSEQFAVAPCVSCFSKGQEYTHGGISLQECVIPEIVFSQDGGKGSADVAISQVQWLGLRCRVIVTPTTPGISADVRTKPGDPASSLTGKKEVDAEGRVGLLVADESKEGTAVCIVLLDSSGRVITKRNSTVGQARLGGEE